MTRELDAEVAEKVMEWDGTHDIERCDGDAWYSCCRNCGATGQQEEILAWDFGDPPVPGCTEPPWYSHSIDKAWLVVEKMREMGWYSEIDNSGDDAVPWVWSFTKYNGADCATSPQCAIAPEAICRAALEAVKD